MENNGLEIRANIKFLTKLDWNPGNIIEALHQVYGDSSPSKSVVYAWIKQFKDGREDLKDNPREGRPSTAKIERTVAYVKNLVNEYRLVTIDMIAYKTGISHGLVFSILNENLGLSKLSASWVPKVLQEDQFQQRAELSLVVLTKIESNESEFLERIVTGDEIWIHQYDPDSKIQSKQWLPRSSAGPVKFKVTRSSQKVIATVFWDSKGVIVIDHFEGQKTITGDYYKGVLHRGILFHHDNAPAHSSRVVTVVLREFRWETLPHNSPDLAPSDFFVSKTPRTLKMSLI